MNENTSVLVCDDDEGILEMLSVLLRMHGYKAILQPKSTELLETIKITNPALLIIDLWMPLVTGDQVARILKNQQETSKIPILAISASDEGENVAIQSGADDFLQKPFDVSSFIAKVKHLIGQSSPK